MIPFVFYLLKVILCSGIFFLYYQLVLRNKLFHRWNRFYLLMAVVVSLVAPLVQVTIYQYITSQQPPAVQLLQAVESANDYLEGVTIYSHKPVGAEQWTGWLYLMVSVGFLVLLICGWFRIITLIGRHSVESINNIRFINTRSPGTPFSFFRYIFWNEAIDLHSTTGQQIFLHELVHVREQHSLDKLFLQLVLVVCWANPFFWLVRRELRMIHEFIADKESVGAHNTADFAAMVLQASYPTRFNALTNAFFQTSIKRRLSMLTKMQPTRFNYFSRILAVSIIALTVLAFTLRTEKISPSFTSRPVTIVIDAGHGKMENGKYNGARSGEIYEDELTLSIAKKMKELNKNPNLRIVLTRSEEMVDLKRRVEISRENNADLFLSIHLNADPDSTEKNGMEVYVSGKEIPLLRESELFGSIIRQELSTIYPTYPGLKKRNAGVWVIDQNVCPVALVELGYLTNEKDRSFIVNPDNQSTVAQHLLRSIEQYFQVKEGRMQTRPTVADTVPGKKNEAPETDPRNNIFQKVDKEASVDKEEWRKFLEENLQSVIEEAAKTKMPAGQYTVVTRFIVEKDGSINSFKVVKDPGYGLGKKTVDVMLRSPKWKPALVNGKTVRSYHAQPVTFVIADE
jgi:N-acetylmuramoyl-L-alanine amidase